MAAIFSRTMRSLEADGSRSWLAVVAAAALLLGAWFAWFVLGRVEVYEIAERARLESRGAVHEVAAPERGRVLTNRLAIGRPVRAGEVVVELDAEAERLMLEEARARLTDLERRLEAVRGEGAAEAAAVAARRAARGVAVEEAEQRAEEAQVRARLAEREAQRLLALGQTGGAAAVEVNRAVAEMEALRATARALRLGASRLERDRRVEERDRQARMAELDRQEIELQGERGVEEARVRRLERAIEERRIRAPVSGRVGEAAELEAGSVVAVGQRLGSIVPPGGVRAVAFFPAAALGRIRVGQRARMRLDSYAWTRYGTVAARVAEVGSEPTGGVFRVDLFLEPDPRSSIPREHGLGGVAEVEVERLSPAALVLRAAGKRLSVRRDPGRGEDG